MSEVPYFAAEMQMKIDQNSCKTGWWRMSAGDCLRRAKQEMGELTRAIQKNKTREEVVGECADVANFVMFLAHNYRQKVKESDRAEG